MQELPGCCAGDSGAGSCGVGLQHLQGKWGIEKEAEGLQGKQQELVKEKETRINTILTNHYRVYFLFVNPRSIILLLRDSKGISVHV